MKRNENIRQAFIQSAIRVVARVGLDKTTTKAIAADAGLNEAYIYRCFESKEDLLRAAFHMADVNFASIIRQNLFHMKNSDLPWKERAFRLWSACWRFVLESRDVCAFYLRYYYSANCRKYAYEEHLQYFQELIAMTAPAFGRRQMRIWSCIRCLTPCSPLRRECSAMRFRMTMRPRFWHLSRSTASWFHISARSFCPREISGRRNKNSDSRQIHMGCEINVENSHGCFSRGSLC